MVAAQFLERTPLSHAGGTKVKSTKVESTLVDIRAEILPVWVGHSCPTPLTLILILVLTLLLRPPRTHVAPWKSGASAPASSAQIRKRLHPRSHPQPRCHPERSMR